MANVISLSGYRGKIDDKGNWGVMTLKEPTNRKVRGNWEKGQSFHNVTLFERDLKFANDYTKEGQFLTVIGELVIDVVENDQGKQKFYKILPREIIWSPKGEAKPKPQERAEDPKDDVPF